MTSPSPDPIEVGGALEGERVDRAVALTTGWSRREVEDLIDQGRVTVDGMAVAKSHRLQGGEIVEVEGAPTPSGPPAPEDVPVTVRYEDRDLMVVSKPAGLVVHPGAGNRTGTLVNGLLAVAPEMAGVGDPMRPGIVHRLDRGTSGLLVVARTPAAYDALVAAMGAREVRRAYRALVWGDVEADEGLIDAPVGRSHRQPTRMTVTPRGREARTRYRVLERFETTTFLAVALETGRTHQVRVHLSSIDHPVVGDPAYGGERREISLDHPFLHAAELEFTHPGTGERLSFDEPLPTELERVLEALR